MALAPAAKRAVPAPENFLCGHLKLAPNNEQCGTVGNKASNKHVKLRPGRVWERHENYHRAVRDGTNVVPETIFQRRGSAEKTKVKQVDDEDEDEDEDEGSQFS